MALSADARRHVTSQDVVALENPGIGPRVSLIVTLAEAIALRRGRVPENVRRMAAMAAEPTEVALARNALPKPGGRVRTRKK